MASFRGYPLHGESVKLPEGYCGLVISESQKPFSENEDRTLKVQMKFKDIYYWNWDQPTSQEDPIQQSMDWLSLSNLVLKFLILVQFILIF